MSDSFEPVSVSIGQGIKENVIRKSRQHTQEWEGDSAPRAPLEYWPNEEICNPQIIWNILVQKYSKAQPSKMASAIEYFN